MAKIIETASDMLDILSLYREIGMVGLSRNPYRPSHFAAIYLLAAHQERPLFHPVLRKQSHLPRTPAMGSTKRQKRLRSQKNRGHHFPKRLPAITTLEPECGSMMQPLMTSAFDARRY